MAMAEDVNPFAQELKAYAPQLRHVEDTNDRSQPRIEPGVAPKVSNKQALLAEIESSHSLKHVEAPQDRSEPRIEDGVKINTVDRGEHLAAIQAAGAHHAVVSELKASGGSGLNHVEQGQVHDRSAPKTDGAHVGKWDKGALLHEIASPRELRHVAPEEVHDRSTPHVEPGTKVQPNHHGELLQEIRSVGSHGLRHVEEAADRSSPQVTVTAAMRVHEGA